MKRLVIAAALCVLVGGVISWSVPANTACEAPEARQFDFWSGSWQVSAKGKVVGHNTISKIHGGCTLLEEYTTPKGYEGKSFNYYDETDGNWHQIWVDNSGTRLHLKGGYSEGRMVMSGDRVRGDGKTVTDRITWHNNADGTVRQVWDVSEDQGQTWKTVFDGIYERE